MHALLPHWCQCLWFQVCFIVPHPSLVFPLFPASYFYLISLISFSRSYCFCIHITDKQTHLTSLAYFQVSYCMCLKCSIWLTQCLAVPVHIQLKTLFMYNSTLLYKFDTLQSLLTAQYAPAMHKFSPKELMESHLIHSSHPTLALW